jgi:bud emergence protein 1
MQQQQQHHHQQGPHHVLGNGVHSIQSPISTLPPGAQQGKTPPSKVIRAIESYRSKGPPELSFEAGDFFHVMGDGQPRAAGNNTNEELWYDAHNPLTRARGIVPASYFQVLGKTQKDTPPNAGSLNTPPLSPPSQARSLPLQAMQPFQQASGSSSSLNLAAANGISPGPSPSTTTFPHRTTSASQASSSSTSKPRARPSPLYGVVQYDFRAERADELDAKRGEPIIVIAQSNHEWFVAKPIGRLGGPGLIPVSFVAISDTTTGKLDFT